MSDFDRLQTLLRRNGHSRLESEHEAPSRSSQDNNGKRKPPEARQGYLSSRIRRLQDVVARVATGAMRRAGFCWYLHFDQFLLRHALTPALYGIASSNEVGGPAGQQPGGRMHSSERARAADDAFSDQISRAARGILCEGAVL